MRVVFLILFILLNVSGVGAETDISVEEYLKQRAKMTGTVDVFDVDLDKVRHLKVMEITDEAVVTRDVDRGDTVKLNVVPGESIKIVSVEVFADQVDMNKEFTDEEIQTAMRGYFEKRSKITGTYMQYDEAAGKMRNLKFESLDPEIRKFGKLSISTATFTDDKSSETVKIDITVVKENGMLSVKSAKIKEN